MDLPHFDFHLADHGVGFAGAFDEVVRFFTTGEEWAEGGGEDEGEVEEDGRGDKAMEAAVFPLPENGIGVERVPDLAGWECVGGGVAHCGGAGVTSGLSAGRRLFWRRGWRFLGRRRVLRLCRCRGFSRRRVVLVCRRLALGALVVLRAFGVAQR